MDGTKIKANASKHKAMSYERMGAKEKELEAEVARCRDRQQSGRAPPQVADPETAEPEPTAQRNFTDPESRIMKDGATKGFEQAYNAQAVVDSTAQIIVAAAITQEANDKRQLQPMLEKGNRAAKPIPPSCQTGTKA